MQRFCLSGGVSHRDARRLRGQSTIEYVLLIAIVALVVIVAGPGVASAIRNQFSTVTDAIGSGTAGENFYDAVDLPDPQNGTAFAVYSEDDHSLMFYKRRGVPKVGDMFNYRKVTEVYTGFETNRYDSKGGANYIPWASVSNNVVATCVVDGGIKPISLAHWFDYFSNMRTCDLSELDASIVTDMNGTFYQNYCLSHISLPKTGFSRIENLLRTFEDDHALTELDPNAFSTERATNMEGTFLRCDHLFIDCSEWNVSNVTNHSDFSLNAPGVTLPKAWQ